MNRRPLRPEAKFEGDRSPQDCGRPARAVRQRPAACVGSRWDRHGKCTVTVTACYVRRPDPARRSVSRGGGGKSQTKRANDRSYQATSSHMQPRSVRPDGTPGHAQRHPATRVTRLTSEGSLVRTQLRPPGKTVHVPPPFLFDGSANWSAFSPGRPRNGASHSSRAGTADRGCAPRDRSMRARAASAACHRLVWRASMSSIIFLSMWV